MSYPSRVVLFLMTLQCIAIAGSFYWISILSTMYSIFFINHSYIKTIFDKLLYLLAMSLLLVFALQVEHWHCIWKIIEALNDAFSSWQDLFVLLRSRIGAEHHNLMYSGLIGNMVLTWVGWWFFIHSYLWGSTWWTVRVRGGFQAPHWQSLNPKSCLPSTIRLLKSLVSQTHSCHCLLVFSALVLQINWQIFQKKNNSVWQAYLSASFCSKALAPTFYLPWWPQNPTFFSTVLGNSS